MRRVLLAASLLGLLVLGGCGSGVELVPWAYNVLIIGWDGAQRQHVQEMMAADELPNLQALADEGSMVDIQVTTGATDTRSGWPQILTGYWPQLTGCYSNSNYAPVPRGYTLHERLEEQYGDENIATVILASKGDYFSNAAGHPWHITAQEVDEFINNVGINTYLGPQALAEVQAHANERFCIFVQFGEPDNLGHVYGENSPQYSAGLADNDVWLGRLRQLLVDLGIADKTFVCVVPDHGFDEGLPTHQNAPDIFFACNYPGLTRPGDRADVAPTVYKILGISPWTFRPLVSGLPLF